MIWERLCFMVDGSAHCCGAVPQLNPDPSLSGGHGNLLEMRISPGRGGCTSPFTSFGLGNCFELLAKLGAVQVCSNLCPQCHQSLPEITGEEWVIICFRHFHEVSLYELNLLQPSSSSLPLELGEPFCGHWPLVYRWTTLWMIKSLTALPNTPQSIEPALSELTRIFIVVSLPWNCWMLLPISELSKNSQCNLNVFCKTDLTCN